MVEFILFVKTLLLDKCHVQTHPLSRWHPRNVDGRPQIFLSLSETSVAGAQSVCMCVCVCVRVCVRVWGRQVYNANEHTHVHIVSGHGRCIMPEYNPFHLTK